MASGRTILRLTIGGLLVGHGLQKLRGSFGGPGLQGTAQMMESIGLHPPKQQAMAAALTETAGGALTAAGLLSPLGPAMIIGAMSVAVAKVHGKNGLWITRGGYEYNLVLGSAAFALAAEGPGALSLDAMFGHRRQGLRWGLVSVAAGLGAAAATMRISDALTPPETSVEGEATEGSPSITTATTGSGGGQEG